MSVVATSRARTPELEELEGDLLHVPADLMDPEAPAEVVARAAESFGGLDVLVNNAGGPPPDTKLPRFGFIDLTDDDWREMFEFNLYSAVRASRAALPLLLERGGANRERVIGAWPLPSPLVDQPSTTGAAKAAMINLTQALAEEFGPSGSPDQRRLPRAREDALVDR